jgi:hypothetical protein
VEPTTDRCVRPLCASLRQRVRFIRTSQLTFIQPADKRIGALQRSTQKSITIHGISVSVRRMIIAVHRTESLYKIIESRLEERFENLNQLSTRLTHWSVKMPKGPQGQKRPADAVANAVMVARIATGEIEDDVGPVRGLNVGRAGAEARTAALSPERRKEIAKAAASARWS